MKKYLLFLNIYLQDRIKSYLFFTLILIPCVVISQSITPTKTVTKNPNSCSIIDIELKIQGANPISRPLEVVLVVDVSGSMGNTISGDTNTSMDYAKDAATDFINTFFLPANNPTNLNRLAIVTYATTGTLRQGLTLSSGKAGLLSIINGLTANGNTNIQDGIVKADNELIANATYNCTTARSIVLLTDGVANRTGTGGSSCTSGTGGTCIQSAITAANNAKTHTVSSVVYNTQIFSVGLFGGISGTDQSNSEYCLNNIQSGGAYFTESGANLTGIYAQIFTQLSWVASQITGIPFEKETVSNNFNIVAGSISVTKGTFTQAGQTINWNIDFLNVETITLKYQITPKPNICGNQTVSTSRLDYRNSQCTNSSQDPPTPTYCVPCAPVLSTLPGPSTINCPATPNFTTPTVTNGCIGSNLTFNDVRTNGNCTGSYSVTRTWTTSNACFTATASQTITVLDNIAPTFTAPANATIYADAQCNYNASVAAVGDVTNEADNCSTGLQATFTDSVADGACQGSHVITRTWNLSDNCGNQASPQVQTITVLDNIAPTFTAPANATIYANAQCNYDASVQTVGDVTNEADNCSTGLQATYTDAVADGQCQGSHIITRTWTLSDNCGNQAAPQTQTITVLDNIAPTFTAPANVTIYADAQCNYDTSVQTVGDVTNEADNCSTGLQATFTDSVADGACQGSHVITRTWTLSDNCGNQAAPQVQTITVLDNIAPTFTAPANATIHTDTQCNYDASVAAVGDVTNEADNCSTGLQATYTDSVADGQCQGSHVITRTWTLSDNCGNQASPQVQTITVLDNIAPTFTAPANATIYADAQCNYNASVAAVGDVTNEADNCSTGLQATFTDSVADGACQGSHVITRTWNLFDNCGNQASPQVQTITVLDNIAPTFTAPANATIHTDTQCNYDASVAAVGDVTNEADNCSTGLQATYTDSVADGQCQGSHVITRTWTLSDNCGNQASPQVQTITVLDNIAPTFTAPANATIYADAQCNYNASVAAVGDVTNEADNCSTGLQATFTDSVADGACQGSHVITRTWNLFDNCGNQASPQVQTITVLDNIAPTFTAPANATIHTDTQCNYDASVAAVGDVTNEADNCSTGLQATYTDSVADGQCQGSHVITRTWTLSDNCGNQASPQVQTITVLDNIAPTFTAPANATIYANAQCNYDASVQTVGDVTNEADNCSTGLQATYTDAVADGQCQGSHIITRTWTLSDNCGNQAAPQTQTITVLDNIAPTFTAPANVTIYADAQCNYDASVQTVGDVTNEADNCSTGLQATFTDSVADGACQGSHVITRTWTLSDNCGNQASPQVQTITVLDNIAPTFTAPANATIYADAQCNYDANPNNTGDVTNEADNCSTGLQATYTDSVTDGQCQGSHIITRTWTLFDNCGNQATPQVQTITVLDNITPIINGEFETSINVSCSNIPDNEPQFQDNCSGVTVIASPDNNTPVNITDYGYTLNQQWIATDACGNQTIAIRTINVTIDKPFENIFVEGPVCTDGGPIDLFSYLDPNIDHSGTWVDVNNSGGLSGSILDPMGIIAGVYKYRYSLSTGSCPRIIEVILTIKDDCIVLPCSINDIKISKVVTPNNDGYNDTFFIGGTEECGFKFNVKIFNRWGALVYENPNYKNDWDGKAKSAISSSNLPAGSYYYIVDIVDSGLDIFTGYIYLGTKN